MISVIVYAVLFGCIFTMLWGFVNFVRRSGRNDVINEQNKKVIEDVKEINKKVANISTTSYDDIRARMSKYTRD